MNVCINAVIELPLQPTVCRKTTFKAPSENCGVDVSAAYQKHYPGESIKDNVVNRIMWYELAYSDL